jgi:hypothetical protein
MALFDSIYLITLAGWAGSALFLSFGVTPLILKHLPKQQAQELVSALLPRYGVWGAICGALALSSLVAVPLCYPEYRGAKVGVQALAIIGSILMALYAGNSVAPARSSGGVSSPLSHSRFLQLSWRAFVLNSLIAVTGIALLIAFATRAAPKTSGIVELTPEEQARYDEAVGRVIEQVEVKYGFRQSSPPRPVEPSKTGRVIDSETVKEIEAYYAEKRRKEDARTGRAASAKAAGDTGAPPGPPRTAR